MMYWSAQLCKIPDQLGAPDQGSHSRMPVGQDKSVTVEPFRILRAKVHVSGPEDMSGWRHTLCISMSLPSEPTGCELTIGAPG